MFAPQHNPYTMKVDRKNRNCHNCGGFGYIARNYRNRRTRDRIGEERRLEYRNNRQRKMIKGGNEHNNNLNRNKDLIVLD